MIALGDRQSHLEAMGVQQWYARTRLAGSLATPEWVLKAPVSSPTVDSKSSMAMTPVVVPESNDTARTNSAMDILKQGGLSNTDREEGVYDKAPSAKVEQSSSVASIENVPDLPAGRALEHFSLVLYKTKGGLVISESSAAQSHPSEFQLLKNILNSKSGLKSLHDDCQFAQMLTWPIFRSLNLQSKQDGELSPLLASWFVSHLSDSDKSILYFGSNYPDIKQFYAELSGSLKATLKFESFQHSLAELIQFPQRKSEVWAQICSLYSE